MQELRKRKPPESKALADKLQALWEEDPSFYPLARQAISEAVVFSTLVCSLLNQSDFEREVADVKPIEDPILSRLRNDVFLSGVRCAVESIGFEAAAQLRTTDRVDHFQKITQPPND